MKLKTSVFQFIIILILLLLMSLSGCQNKNQAQIEFSHNDVDLKTYRSFSWPDDKPLIIQPDHIDANLVNQIKQSVLKTLLAKGYQFKLNPTSADFIVSYSLSSSNDKTYEPSSTLEIKDEKCNHPLTYSVDFIGQEFNDDLYTKMILSIFDVKKCIVVWQARVGTKFNPHARNTHQVAEIDSTVNELLKDFPSENK